MDLFTPVLPPDRLHPNFAHTLASESASVREVLQDWAHGFPDRDRKFVQEFQASYNSCFWELYLFAVLKNLNIALDFAHAAPDFVAADLPLAIEAVIASNACDDVPEWEKTVDGVAHDDLESAYLRSIARLSNAFKGKLEAYQRYSALPHMAGRSFVIAIANYGTQDFHLLGDVAMQRLFYDVWEEGDIRKANGASLSLGLFESEAHLEVAAVLYSSLATFGKARALSKDDGANIVFHAARIRDNSELIRIRARKSDYVESLTDGLRLFVNPYANFPLDPRIFNDPGIRCFVPDQEGNLLVSCHPDGDLCMRMVHRLTETV
jgi:hypothetical protein